jgi:flagellar biosynthesis/type III secretory pathway protein FliH
VIAANAKPYSFPTLMALTAPPQTDEPSPDEAEVTAAIARGYADGFERGRGDAEEQAKSAVEASRREGFEAGRAAAHTAIERALGALEDGLDKLGRERDALAGEAESFCVDLSLAMVSRLLEEDSVRADFVARAVAEALKNLAPEIPRAIYLNPADLALMESQLNGLAVKGDENLAPGHARVDAGRLLVDGGIDQAFLRIKSAVLSTRERRLKGREA